MPYALRSKTKAETSVVSSSSKTKDENNNNSNVIEKVHKVKTQRKPLKRNHTKAKLSVSKPKDKEERSQSGSPTVDRNYPVKRRRSSRNINKTKVLEISETPYVNNNNKIDDVEVTSESETESDNLKIIDLMRREITQKKLFSSTANKKNSASEEQDENGEEHSADPEPGPSNGKVQNKRESIKLRKVLFHSYMDIIARLNLDHIPECLTNVYHCIQAHSIGAPGPIMATVFLRSKQLYLTEANRLLLLSKIVNVITNKNYFWGNEIFFTIFKTVLTVKSSEELGCSPDYVINDYVLLFENVLRAFPPCWKESYIEYNIFLDSKISTQDYLPEKNNIVENNMFIFIMNQLNDMGHENENDKEEKNNDDDGTKSPELSQFFSYNVWEENEMSYTSLSSHSRDEKMKRLFTCLHLLTKTLESDLSVWMLHYITDPASFLFSEEKPFIIKIFNIYEYNLVNDTVRKFLQLFVKCVWVQFPEESLKIMERVVSLLAVVSNLADISLKKNGISYPKTGPHTDRFVNDFFKIIQNIVGTNISIYISIIKMVSIPYVKYKLINLLLAKISMKPLKNFCIQLVYDDLSKYSWQYCSLKEPSNDSTETSNEPSNEPPNNTNNINEVPVDTNEVPVDTNEVPVDTNELPIDTNELPVDTNEVPVDIYELPIDTNNLPIETNELPINTNEVPVDIYELPIDTNNLPIDTNELPIDTNEIPVDSIEPSNNLNETSNTDKNNSSPSSKYPSLNSVNKQTRAAECYQDDYLMLLLEGMKAYCNFYSLNKYAMILCCKPIQSYFKLKTPYRILDPKHPSNKIFNKKLGKKRRWKKLLKKVKPIPPEQVFNYDILNVGLLTNEEQELYLNDIQCMMKFKKIIPELNAIYANKFNDWVTYIDQFFRETI